METMTNIAARRGAACAVRTGMTRREARMIAEELWKLMQRERPQAEEEWLTVKEAAAYMKCSTWTVYHNIEVLPHTKTGGRLMFTKAGLSEWMKRRTEEELIR